MTDQTRSPKKSDLIAFLNRAALLMRVQLPAQRAQGLADFIIEQQFPANLFHGKTLNSLIAAFSDHFPSAQQLNDHLTRCLENQDRERQQRGAAVDQDLLKRLIMAYKVLEQPPLYPRGYSDDAKRNAVELRDKFPQAYAQVAQLPQAQRRPINRPATSNVMPMSEVIERVAKYLDPMDASAYRALMSIPTEQRSEQERDQIFALVRVMLKRSGLTGSFPEPRSAPAGAKFFPPEDGLRPPIGEPSPEDRRAAPLAELGLREAPEIIEPAPPPRRNRFDDDL